jgi:glycosyltransferase A (GT-A) superfamily protein (DUF2064 family)
MPRNRLGVFVRSPVAEANAPLYLAFLADFCERLCGSKHRPVVFLAGERTPDLAALLDPHWEVVAQVDGSQGDRLTAAFAHLLRIPGDRAVIIGSGGPDVPLPYLKRAFQALKHRDVVLGPAIAGGCYLIGLRGTAPALFREIAWGTPAVFAQILAAIERERLTLGLVPPWYDVDDPASLRFFTTLVRARRLAGAGRLRQSELAVATLSRTGE